jgi:hypothetical protein
MLHLHECAEPAPAKPLHFVGHSTAVEESGGEPLHSANDPTVAESTAEPSSQWSLFL